jgi:peptide chain release factor 2
MRERLENLHQKIVGAMELLKIAELKKRLDQLSAQMNAPGFWQDQKSAQAISQDYQDIKSEVERWEILEKKITDLLDLEKAGDKSLEAEIESQATELEQEFLGYELALLLNQPYDKNNALVSVHAGAGGTEAQDWAEMLVRMLLRFSESQKWKAEILDESRGQEAGYKSITFRVVGRNAFGYLKSEHGVHRLVRISPFDAEKMRHTSFALVEVLPELDDSVNVEIKPEDLRIDTFMSGGKGGQSVNTTYSAVRIVHIPTGISVQCQNERSQTQNKEMAMKILRGKLHRLEEEKKAKERQELRGEFKSAEWGNQIRSYVLHPYHMVNDHRTEFKSTDPESVLEGKLLPLSEAYLRWIKS